MINYLLFDFLVLIWTFGQWVYCQKIGSFLKLNFWYRSWVKVGIVLHAGIGWIKQLFLLHEGVGFLSDVGINVESNLFFDVTLVIWFVLILFYMEVRGLIHGWDIVVATERAAEGGLSVVGMNWKKVVFWDKILGGYLWKLSIKIHFGLTVEIKFLTIL